MRRGGAAQRRARHGFRGLAGNGDLRRHAVQSDGGADCSEIARHDALLKHLLGPGQVGDARRDLPAGERLHEGKRCVAVHELREHDALERTVVFSQDEVAEPLAHFLLDRGELPADVIHVAAAHGELGLQLRVMRAESELYAAVRRERLQSRQQAVGVRFADPVGMEALQKDRGLLAGLREQPWNDLLLEHPAQLARHARREEEPRLADIQGKAASGANRVVEHFGVRGQHRLLPVIRRHHAAAAVKVRFHPREPLVGQYEVDAGGLRCYFLGQIVERRTQSAVYDDRVGALPGEPERKEQTLAIVSDRGFPLYRKPEILELLADVAEVGVDDLAGEDFVTGAYDFDPHAGTGGKVSGPAS